MFKYIVLICVVFVVYGCKNENLEISHPEYIFGIDVSHYQGKINWNKVKTSHHPIKFVFIRSTMGQDGVDTEYKANWKGAKQTNLIRGVYHYYRPNENSTKQFENFANNVSFSEGDFYPVLDVEEMSKFGADNLQKGVANWLRLAEQKYGVKPILYSGRVFYNRYLKAKFSHYPLWIASYSNKQKIQGMSWNFHQFTEKVSVNGIKGKVDGNDFNGNDLQKFCF